jgi:leucyl aminopeptidase|tara:strand:+ start:32 stop:1447 length:1416 start_codon:yes stop_codon:yes gene_type:complete
MNDAMKITTYTPDYNGSIAIVYTETKELSQHLNPAQLDRVRALGEKFEEKWLEVQAGTDTAWVYKIGNAIDADARAEKMRQAGNTLVLKANAAYLDRIAILGVHVPHVSEGAILGNYQFLRYFSDSHKRKNSMAQLFVSKEDEQTLAPIAIATMGALFARELVNTPVIDLTATDLANQAKEASKRHGFSIEVLEKKQIESLKMGGLLAVNYGSPEPPVFIIMEHKPKNATNEKPLVLVGKGVVYDTGGLSLKPSNFMDDMKSDMGGAAAVIGAMSAAAEANLPVHIIGLVPATDNRPGGNAVTPGDVITISDGTSVEVMNTDAEGRLILSDALVYAKRYNPELVIDLATLTGAAARSIGRYAIVGMGNAPKERMIALQESGYRTHERVVEFPFWDEYKDLLKSPIADMKNIGGAEAGAITAGKFLEHFTDYPYIHLDIAGPAFLKSRAGYQVEGGTGIGVRLLFDFINNLK